MINSYIICKTNRTGSGALEEALLKTGVAGKPSEQLYIAGEKSYLKHYGAESGEELLAKIIENGSSDNGVFGLSVELPRRELLPFVREVTGKEVAYADLPVLVDELFGKPQYVWLTRRNKVRQAVSWWKAAQSEV